MKNLGDMMKQVQAMQSRMAEMQAKLEQTTVTGQSGGGLVKVTLTGKGVMTALAIDPSLLKPEEKDILEDLIIAAHTDAKIEVRGDDGAGDAVDHRRPAAAAGLQAALLS